MRKTLLVLVLLAGAVGIAVARAEVGNPDSKTQSLNDGCNRSQLALLGEGAVNLTDVNHPTLFPSWVYVNGDPTPKTVEGTELGTHTAGTDLFGVHKTYDANFDIAPDPADAASWSLLSTRNLQENPPQIHTEWESGLVPPWAWPSPGDHVQETGSFIWDCGHWQDGARQVPDGDYVPGDPLGTGGVEPVGGEEAEIHPVQELATWRHQAWSPDAHAPASQLDLYISNQGGKAKAVENCALSSPAHDPDRAAALAAGEGCSTVQQVAGRDYTYVIDAPGPAPSATSVLQWSSSVRVHDNAPANVDVVQEGDHVKVTVPFSAVQASSDLQDFGATVLVWWSDGAASGVRHFQVAVKGLTIYNNLDGDINEDQSDPTITPNGEWNMYLDAGGSWLDLHDPLRASAGGDYVPELGSVPSAKPNGVALDVSHVPAFTVSAPSDGNLRFFVDARECDLPGYTDCPTQNELDFNQFPGRGEVVLPVTQLAGSTSTVAIHPPVCDTDAGCPEEKSKPSQCPAPNGCWLLTLSVQDLDAPAGAGLVVVGDGTAAGTTVNNLPASGLSWWHDPVSRHGNDQEEEHAVISAVIRSLRERHR